MNKKLEQISKQNCEPCDKGVKLYTAKKVCLVSDKVSTNKACNHLYESAVLEEIPIDDYFKKVKGICREKQAKDIIESLIDKK